MYGVKNALESIYSRTIFEKVLHCNSEHVLLKECNVEGICNAVEMLFLCYIEGMLNVEV